MKHVLCAFLMLGLSSTALAAKPYYVCDLQQKGVYSKTDTQVLVQFDKGRIAIKGETLGLCIGQVKHDGDNDYKADLGYAGEYASINKNCYEFNRIQWRATNQGFASIDGGISLSGSIGGIWAEYNCK